MANSPDDKFLMLPRKEDLKPKRREMSNPVFWEKLKKKKKKKKKKKNSKCRLLKILLGVSVNETEAKINHRKDIVVFYRPTFSPVWMQANIWHRNKNICFSLSKYLPFVKGTFPARKEDYLNYNIFFLYI